jgi:hypothetical protein
VKAARMVVGGEEMREMVLVWAWVYVWVAAVS